MHVESGTEAAQFPEKEYISGIFVAVCVWEAVCVCVCELLQKPKYWAALKTWDLVAWIALGRGEGGSPPPRHKYGKYPREYFIHSQPASQFFPGPRF